MHHQNIDLLHIHLTRSKNVSSSTKLTETFNVQLRCTFKAYHNQESILLNWKDISLWPVESQKNRKIKQVIILVSTTPTNANSRKL